MNNSTISAIGIYLYALVMGFFGVNHFLNAESMSGMVPGYMPGSGKMWIFITGAALVLAAIAIITGMYRKIACLLLALMLIIFVLTMHVPRLADGDSSAMPSVLKDTALAAAALIIAGKG